MKVRIKRVRHKRRRLYLTIRLGPDESSKFPQYVHKNFKKIEQKLTGNSFSVTLKRLNRLLFLVLLLLLFILFAR